VCFLWFKEADDEWMRKTYRKQSQKMEIQCESEKHNATTWKMGLYLFFLYQSHGNMSVSFELMVTKNAVFYEVHGYYCAFFIASCFFLIFDSYKLQITKHIPSSGVCYVICSLCESKNEKEAPRNKKGIMITMPLINNYILPDH